MLCPRCHSENPEGKKYCGDCGGLLHEDVLNTAIRREVAEELDARLKDQKVLEIETTQAIASRLSEWVKLFAFFVGIPLSLLVIILGFLGLKTYSDFLTQINAAKEQALKPLESTKTEAAKIAQAYKDLDAQLQQNKQLSANVQTLSAKVESIEVAIKFMPSASLSPELKRNLRETFGRYYEYLKNAGFKLAKAPPTVVVVTTSGKGAGYYTIDGNRIILSPDVARLPNAGLTLYTFHALSVVRPKGFSSDKVRIEQLFAGLGDYFPCSFTGQSDFGKEYFESLAKDHPEAKIAPRNVDNHRRFSEINDGTELHDGGNVWAGAFWQLRGSIGQDATDKLLVTTWKHFDFPAFVSEMATFPEELIRQDRILYAGVHGDKIQSVFEERGLKLWAHQ
jgi:hypothetical protein